MRKFWAIYLFIALALSALFCYFLYSGITKDDSEFLTKSKNMIYISTIQFLIGLVYAIITLKKQSSWTILYLCLLILVVVSEIILFFGSLGGLLG